MNQHEVDLIIPVHSATRPVRRAAKSVLDHTKLSVRVTVIAHNIDQKVIEKNLGDLTQDARLRILHLSDFIASPSGPMNLGLSKASAPYVSLLGSDDMLSPGALDSWHRIAVETGATTVIPRIEGGVSGVLPLPPTRRARARELDAVKDRLLYRCTPVGLISRLHFPDLRFAPYLSSGEDLAFTAELWFRGRHIAYDRSGPSYTGPEDELDRVSSISSRSIEEDFGFLEAVEGAAWFPSLSKQQRLAFGVKTLRLHVFDAIAGRLAGEGGIAPHLQALRNVIERIEAMAPGSRALLSRADRGVLDELSNESPSPENIVACLGMRWSGDRNALLPRNPLLALHPQAPYLTLRNSRP
ncbi:MAG: glycosyltransferase family 2 protein [Actinobacteria bacterium]|nr:glycosyltransferase family 2 protein [Actinomycetota bacterium]